jgi:hypothetical protein
MPGLPDLILSATLAQLSEDWLEVKCCRGTTYLPLRLLARDRGPNRPVGDVVALLRCQHCRQPPAEVALAEDATGQERVGGPPSGWRVILARRGPATTTGLGGAK